MIASVTLQECQGREVVNVACDVENEMYIDLEMAPSIPEIAIPETQEINPAIDDEEIDYENDEGSDSSDEGSGSTVNNFNNDDLYGNGETDIREDTEEVSLRNFGGVTSLSPVWYNYLFRRK